MDGGRDAEDRHRAGAAGPWDRAQHGSARTVQGGSGEPAWNGDSWVLPGPTGSTLAQAVGVVLWSVSMVGFAALAGIVFGWLPQSWWVPLAVVASVASLAGVLIFPTAFPTFSTIGAVAVDVAVLVAVLGRHWSPSDLAA